MKKWFFVLVAASMIAVFAIPASATEVKFFGDYFVKGLYTSNYSLGDPSVGGGRGLIAQRFRLNTIFQVAEGLTVTTRFDALERAWGQDAALGTPNMNGWANGVPGTHEENNFSWERAYATFNLGPGFFDVGYQAEGYWSPVAFGNTTGSGPVLRYTVASGPLTLSAYWEKAKETEFNPVVYSPKDWDRYAIQGTYKWKAGAAGLQLQWDTYESDTAAAYNIAWNNVNLPAGKVNFYELSPFVQAKFGIVDLEGKLYWSFGEFEPKAGGSDIDLSGISFYLNGKANLGPAYIGGQFAYIKGDDGNAADDEMTVSHGGQEDWDPCLILGNDHLAKWMGGRFSVNQLGHGTSTGPIPFRGGWNEQNVWVYQVYAGYNPTPKLALRTSFTYMKVDETYLPGQDDHLGNEFDITAVYKIYPNLQYEVGFGYLWTGDWFKGTNAAGAIDDTFLLMHALTLTF